MGWYEAFKDAITVAQKADNVELTKQLIDLQQQMFDMQKENQDLKTELRDFQQAAKTKDSLVYRNNHYYLRQESGAEDGPFCSVCWDVESRLVRMFGNQGMHWCQYCTTGRKR